MTPKADTDSPEAVRAHLKGILAADAKHMAHYRSAHWPPDGGRWTPARILDGMIQNFAENHRDDPEGGWDEWLSIAEELRGEQE